MSDDDADTVLLTGASGSTYEFKVFHPDDAVPPVGGVFVVAGSAPEGTAGIHGGRPVWLVGRAANLSHTLSQVKRHARVAAERGWRYCVRFERENPAARSRIARDLAAGLRVRRGGDGRA